LTHIFHTRFCFGILHNQIIQNVTNVTQNTVKTQGFFNTFLKYLENGGLIYGNFIKIK